MVSLELYVETTCHVHDGSQRSWKWQDRDHENKIFSLHHIMEEGDLEHEEWRKDGE
jgi:hypothetical protein